MAVAPYVQQGLTAAEVAAAMASAGIASPALVASTAPTAPNSMSSVAAVAGIVGPIPPLPAFPPPLDAAEPPMMMLPSSSLASAESRSSVPEDAWQAFVQSTKRLEEQKAELDCLARNLRARSQSDDVESVAIRKGHGHAGNVKVSVAPPVDLPRSLPLPDTPSGSSGPPKSHRSAQRVHAALRQALADAGVRPGESDVAGPIQCLSAIRRANVLLRGSPDPTATPPTPVQLGHGCKGDDPYIELSGLIWQLIGGDSCDLSFERRSRGTPTPPQPVSDSLGNVFCAAEPSTDSLGQIRWPHGGG